MCHRTGWNRQRQRHIASVANVQTLPRFFFKFCFFHAWTERSYANIAGAIRADRSRILWEAMVGDPRRRRTDVKQSRSGFWSTLEDPCVQASRYNWRDIRDACSSKAEWLKHEPIYLSGNWLKHGIFNGWDTAFVDKLSPVLDTGRDAKYWEYKLDNIKFPEILDGDVSWGLGCGSKQAEFVTDNQTLADVLCGRTVPPSEHEQRFFGQCTTQEMPEDPIV